jgi:uncharacterized surface protein with fasciclin (FAS1) repeats
MNRKVTLLITLIFVLQATQFVQADDHETDQTIVDVASSTGSHDSLVAALNHVGLADTLAGDGPFTVFAPTDQAFTDAGINLDDFDTEEENNTLSDILLYHVISGAAVDAANVTDGMTAEAANGDTLSFTVTNDSVIVGDATVTSADVEASNGIIHVIDKVLMPPAEVVEEPATVACDVTVGVVDTAYDRPSVSIDVGQTVCWEWTEADMPHNVAEIEDISSTEILTGGIYSGEAEGTVFFSYTFTENTTFYYACEPHLMMNMKGEVIVGTGIDANDVKTDDSDKSTESTPGFLLATSIIAMIGAVLVLSRRS